MAVSPHKQIAATEVLEVAEHLRVVLSRWVRTTRDQTGTPSSAKLETLRLLQDEGAMPIAALARRRAVKHQSMRLVTEQLAEEGEVSKQTDPDDRRNQSIGITEKGRATVKEAQRVRARCRHRVTRGQS